MSNIFIYSGTYPADTRDIMKTYYSQVPHSTLLKLYKIYEDDFLSFGYKIPDHR